MICLIGYFGCAELTSDSGDSGDTGAVGERSDSVTSGTWTEQTIAGMNVHLYVPSTAPALA
ncbi:MAG: hypothetical protein AAGC55_15905, partial [Myxococcota bacterium]